MGRSGNHFHTDPSICLLQTMGNITEVRYQSRAATPAALSLWALCAAQASWRLAVKSLPQIRSGILPVEAGQPEPERFLRSDGIPEASICHTPLRTLRVARRNGLLARGLHFQHVWEQRKLTASPETECSFVRYLIRQGQETHA